MYSNTGMTIQGTQTILKVNQPVSEISQKIIITKTLGASLFGFMTLELTKRDN